VIDTTTKRGRGKHGKPLVSERMVRAVVETLLGRALAGDAVAADVYLRVAGPLPIDSAEMGPDADAV